MTNKDDQVPDLSALEARVDQLIEIVGKLTTDNTALRDQQGHLVSERAELIEKTEKAKSKIESMIARLRVTPQW